MKLSNTYIDRTRYAFVYHILPGSEKVEFVRDRFFDSETAAWKWFIHKGLNAWDFTDLEVVTVQGFSSLIVERISQRGEVK